MFFHNRPYSSTGNDLTKLIALVRAAWRHKRRNDANFYVGDLCWRLRESEYEQTLWLWENEEGRLAGFAEWSAAEKSLEIQLHPEYADAGLDAQMLAWSEAWVGSVSANPAATRLYESCGMQVVRRDYHFSRQSA